MSQLVYDYDVVVVGAGHAGAEAALAAARMGLSTILLTMNADTVAQMSCNPAIGGVAKGQIVREIDALGGEMAKVIDATGVQFRMLNRTKGPAMHSPRAQADKKLYQFTMKHRVEAQANLTLRQEIAEALVFEKCKSDSITATRRIVGVMARGVTVPRLKTRSCASPIRSGIRSFWSPKAGTRSNTIATASARAYRRMCSKKCSGTFQGSNRPRFSAGVMPSSMITLRRRNCT